MQVARFTAFHIISADGKINIWGGCECFESVESYDPRSDEWTWVTEAPLIRPISRSEQQYDKDLGDDLMAEGMRSECSTISKFL